MSSLLTLSLYLIAIFLYKKNRFILFIPVFFTVTLCALIVYLTSFSYERYFAENRPITFLLEPTIVALGVLLYKQMPIIRANFTPLLISIVSSSFVSALLVMVLATLFKLPQNLMASLLPLGVTTPIAIEVAKSLGGNPAITSVIVLVVGLFGSLISPTLLKCFRIEWLPAKGLALGQSSHGIGTARAVEIDEQIGTFSGLAMSLNGLITVFVAPLVWSLFLP